MGCCYISRLPDHILMTIFCKVPITTVAECRYVCKSWIDILSHPIFANTFKQSTTSTGATSLVLCVKTDDLYFLEFPQGSESPFSLNLVAEFVKRPPPEALEHNHRLRFVNSCNGLVCVREVNPLRDSFIHILNPVTREYITLPPFEEERERHIAVDLCGIGFSPKTNQFKAIRFFAELNDLSYDLNCEVYTLGTGTWRNIGLVPELDMADWICADYFSFEAFVNGFFHWLILTRDHTEYDRFIPSLCTFDFESEKFETMWMPPPEIDDDTYQYPGLGVFNNSIYFAGYDFCHEESYQIWLMREYGVVESWTKILVIELDWARKCFPYDFCFILAKLFENGDLLLLHQGDTFLYNSRSKIFTKLDAPEIKSSIRAIVHEPSFVSLKAIVKDDSSCEVRKLNCRGAN